MVLKYPVAPENLYNHVSITHHKVRKIRMVRYDVTIGT
jgi:hypothetical protein